MNFILYFILVCTRKHWLKLGREQWVVDAGLINSLAPLGIPLIPASCCLFIAGCSENLWKTLLRKVTLYEKNLLHALVSKSFNFNCQESISFWMVLFLLRTWGLGIHLWFLKWLKQQTRFVKLKDFSLCRLIKVLKEIPLHMHNMIET